MTPSIKQFKLTNDDEVICEVLQWDSEDDSAIIVRAALRIMQGEDLEKGYRFFAFRPWMGFADDPETLHTLNAAHIIGEVTPSEALLKHYHSTIKKLLIATTQKKHDFDMDKMSDLDDDEIEDYIRYHLSQEELEEEEEISNGENVIKFPTGKTFH